MHFKIYKTISQYLIKLIYYPALPQLLAVYKFAVKKRDYDSLLVGLTDQFLRKLIKLENQSLFMSLHN